MSPSVIAPPAPVAAVRLVCRQGQCYRVSRRHSYRRAYRSYTRPRYEERRYYSEDAYPRPRYYREQTEFRGYREDSQRFGYQERQFMRPEVGVRLSREREEDED